MRKPRNPLIWLLTLTLLGGQVLGVHAHVCSEQRIKCVNDAHADAPIHSHAFGSSYETQADADEDCLDFTIEVADGLLAKAMDPHGDVHAGPSTISIPDWSFRPCVGNRSPDTPAWVRIGAVLTPPSQGPPLTL